MSESSKAVFLSYASQDAEAAKRICAALRAAGMEVWFDADGGLEHGDEWDAKIRRQIKDCVLFLPVISSHTQAREEGYFRIEWDLAAERARGIASGVAFILPVVIDDTKEPDALVPDRFRSVQWTRLRAGVVPPEVQTRLAKLWSQRTGGYRHSESAATVAATGERASSAVPPKKKPARVAAIVAGVGLLAVGLVGWRLGSSRAAAPAMALTAAVPAPTRAEFPRDPELKHALQLLYKIDAIADDFALAEDIAKPVIEARPNDPEVATVAAMISQEYLTRGFDTSEARRTRVQRLTERAVQLAPDEPDALAALSRYLVFMGMQIPRAEELIRRAIQIKSDQPRYHRVLLQVLNQGQPAEAEKFAAQMIARFPHDALAQYDVARGYKDRNDIPAMEKAIDATLAAGPVPNAMIWKSWLMLDVHGDLAGAKAWLDRVPQRQRANVRYANALSIYGIVSGDTEQAIKVLEFLPDAWLTDFDFHGPKAQLLGDLLRVAGRTDLGRLQYEVALAEIQRAKAADTTDLRLRYAELWTLLGLDRRTEALAVFKLLLESQTRPFRARNFNSWWGGLIRAGFLLGEREPPLTMLREAVVEPTIRESFRHQIGIDPAMAPWRDDPDIVAALAGSGQPAADAASGLPVAEKSVAVLAFANLSDDKGNEYFSDGVSEELLNVLAKVPGLKVTARTSSFHFKGKDTPVRDIAQQLGVAYVVEGSVRKQGDKVRITAQLIKAADGFRVWSDTFTRDLKDIFAVQDEIAALIAQNLKLTMGLGATTPRRTVNPEAHQLVLEGRYFWNLRTDEGYDRAEAAFVKAIELDPQFAEAYAGLADVRWIRAVYTSYAGVNFVPSTVIQAETARALALDPNLAEAYPVMGAALHWSDRIKEAAAPLQKAIALNPNYALAHHWYSLVLEGQGRLDSALVEIDRAIQLDPLSVAALSTRHRYLQMAGRMPEALAAADKTQALRPGFFFGTGLRAQLLLAIGRRDEALAVAREVVAFPGLELRWMNDAAAVDVLRQLGHHAEAEEHIKNLLPRLPADSYLRGVALAALDRWDEAEPYLARTPPGLRSLFFWNSVWDRWRADPRFGQLMQTLHCTEEYGVARATLARMQRATAERK